MVRAADDVRRIRPKAGTERVPPQNLEAEESVLGSMMLSPDAIADVIEIVRPADFYRSANAKIFDTLREIYGRGRRAGRGPRRASSSGAEARSRPRARSPCVGADEQPVEDPPPQPAPRRATP